MLTWLCATDHERQILDWIRLLVEEAQSSTMEIFGRAAQEEGSIASVASRLSVAVLKIWARIFRSNNIWAIVNCIGQSLELYAGMIEEAVPL
jgi:hypothetical protein